MDDSDGTAECESLGLYAAFASLKALLIPVYSGELSSASLYAGAHSICKAISLSARSSASSRGGQY